MHWMPPLSRIIEHSEGTSQKSKTILQVTMVGWTLLAIKVLFVFIASQACGCNLFRRKRMAWCPPHVVPTGLGPVRRMFLGQKAGVRGGGCRPGRRAPALHLCPGQRSQLRSFLLQCISWQPHHAVVAHVPDPHVCSRHRLCVFGRDADALAAVWGHCDSRRRHAFKQRWGQGGHP